MAPPDRTGGGGPSLQTLTVASAASASAALVTSKLFPPGTVVTAALTPVIVALVSEMLHRPVTRVTEIRSRGTVVREPGAPLEAEPPPAPWPEDDEPRPGRRLHPKLALATGLAAFAIAAAALTLPELLFGGAVASGKKTTIFGGKSTPTKSEPAETEPARSEEAPETVTETAPAQTPATQTETAPAEAPPEETTPQDGGTTAPPEAGTGTAPSQTPPVP